jgi:hypothetical protein
MVRDEDEFGNQRTVLLQNPGQVQDRLRVQSKSIQDTADGLKKLQEQVVAK